jgi:hypothetical protein
MKSSKRVSCCELKFLRDSIIGAVIASSDVCFDSTFGRGRRVVGSFTLATLDVPASALRGLPRFFFDCSSVCFIGNLGGENLEDFAECR